MTETPFGDSRSRDESSEATEITRAIVSTDYKVRGEKAATSGTGVLGHNTASSGESYGVEGVTEADGDVSNDVYPAGVAARATGSNTTFGVYGRGESKDTTGVVGDATTNSTAGPGESGSPTGVAGVTDRSGADSGVNQGYGVVGSATAFSGLAYGVFGATNSTSAGAAGIKGVASQDGNAHGVIGETNSTSAGAAGIKGIASNDAAAVEAQGDVEVDGTVSASKVGARLEMSSDQTVPDGGFRDIQFDTTRTDHFNDGFSGNTFFIREDGSYHVEIQLMWKSPIPPNSSVDLECRVNGDIKSGPRFEADNMRVNSIGFTAFDQTEPSFDFSIRQYNVDDNSYDIDSDDDDTYVTIHKVG